MDRRRSSACLAVAVLALVLTGCFGDDNHGKRARRIAREFALAVETISKGIDAQSADASTELNNVADGTIKPRSGIAALTRRARAMDSARMRLERLKAPASAKATLANLELLVGDLARDLESTTSDIRAAQREHVDVHDAAIAGARLVQAGSSGVSTLSSALLTLVAAT